MRDAFVLRYALIPYLYTEARKTYETGVAFFRPLYYEWPDVPRPTPRTITTCSATA